jgi:hypothetical protein
VPTSMAGLRRLHAWAHRLGHPIAWGVEGTGSYGAGWPARWPTAATRCWKSAALTAACAATAASPTPSVSTSGEADRAAESLS